MGPGQTTDDLNGRLRALPSVQWLAAQLDPAGGAEAVAAARTALERARAELLADASATTDPHSVARELLERGRRPSPRRVINATGVIVHTNLGRAPLAAAAREALREVAEGYSDLEFDVERGDRGSRHAHIESVLCELTGAESGLAVNNCAAATLLATAALAGPGRSIVVSRGQLVEIGGSFRIPEVIAASGSAMIEVGTTNRTRLADYERALASAPERPVGAILRVHQSNFRTLGFVEEVEIEALCDLGMPVIDDVGSGVLGVIEQLPLQDEPSVRRSLRAGAALVCFSGDKLLGGPQAGLLVGRADAIARARAHPLARALRIDKLSLAALRATLALYRDPQRALHEVPVLAMLAVGERELADRATRLAEGLRAAGVTAEIVDAVAKVGGGALPLLELRGPVVALGVGSLGADDVAAALRGGDPPVVARIAEGRVLLDPRTLAADEIDAVVAAARACAALAATAG
jgi:L-seryl-tRNA(Ser) seleniumtransferase